MQTSSSSSRTSSASGPWHAPCLRSTKEGKRTEKDVQTILLRIYQSDSDLMVVLPQAVNGFLANATYGNGW